MAYFRQRGLGLNLDDILCSNNWPSYAFAGKTVYIQKNPPPPPKKKLEKLLQVNSYSTGHPHWVGELETGSLSINIILFIPVTCLLQFVMKW